MEQTTEKRISFTIYPAPSVLEKLKAIADTEKRSVNGQALYFIEAGIQTREAEQRAQKRT